MSRLMQGAAATREQNGSHRRDAESAEKENDKWQMTNEK
jgi:hypothetical protein